MKSGDGTPTTPRGQKTQEAILAAAFTVAVTDGLDGLRTRAVADRAGVNIATLHYYFPHKEDLEYALLHWLLARFREQPPHRRGRWPAELATAVAWGTDGADFLALWYAFWVRGLKDVRIRAILKAHLEGWQARWTDLVSDDPNPAAATFWMAVALGLPILTATGLQGTEAALTFGLHQVGRETT